jgi:hypothetical protein
MFTQLINWHILSQNLFQKNYFKHIVPSIALAGHDRMEKGEVDRS